MITVGYAFASSLVWILGVVLTIPGASARGAAGSATVAWIVSTSGLTASARPLRPGTLEIR